MREATTVLMTLVNWNVEWATPGSPRRAGILRRIDRHAPEVICLTETHIGLLSPGGHSIYSQPDYGYPIKEGRRKVLLWSREPWKNVDDVGIDSMPPGRFVAGVTQASVGEVTVVGVCIPWSWSRVRGSGVKRKMWEDHEQLVGLADVSNGYEPSVSIYSQPDSDRASARHPAAHTRLGFKEGIAAEGSAVVEGTCWKNVVHTERHEDQADKDRTGSEYQSRSSRALRMRCS